MALMLTDWVPFLITDKPDIWLSFPDTFDEQEYKLERPAVFGTTKGLFGLCNASVGQLAQKWWAQIWAEAMQLESLQGTYSTQQDLPA